MSDKIDAQIENLFDILGKIKGSKISSTFERIEQDDIETLKSVYDRPIEQVLSKAENISRIETIFDAAFNFDLIKISPLPLLIIIMKSSNATSQFEDFLKRKVVLTTRDTSLILTYLQQTDFKNAVLVKKLDNHPQLRKVMNVYTKARIESKLPGYFSLTKIQVERLADKDYIIEQIRLRVLSERTGEYSVALNHLLNEIHAICKFLDPSPIKMSDYRAPQVQAFLLNNGVTPNICAKVRNLFDRRNRTPVSHPGSTGNISWSVTEKEYWEYHKSVGKCLQKIL